MDMICDNNFTRLCGSMSGKPVYSHSSRSQQFYIFPLEVERLSGNRDVINIVVRREQLAALEAKGVITLAERLKIENET